MTAYRLGFQQRHATIGRHPGLLAEAGVWVLPNPSGLNAPYQLDTLAEEFARLRTEAAATVPRVGLPRRRASD